MLILITSIQDQLLTQTHVFLHGLHGSKCGFDPASWQAVWCQTASE